MKIIKIAALMIATVFSFTVYAQPGVAVGSATGQDGTSVVIPVIFTGDGVANGVQLDINYDNSILIPDLTNCGTAGGSVVNTTVTCQISVVGGINVVRILGFSIPSAISASGTLGDISFAILAGTPPQVLPISVSGEAYSNSAPDGSSTDGQITVTAGPQPDWSSFPAGGSTLTFPSVIAGGSNPTQLVAVTNAGALGSTLTGNCSLVGAPELTITSGAAINLSNGVSSNVNLACDAAAAGTFTGTLECTHNGDGTTEASPVGYSLTCTITPPGQAQYASTPADGTAIAMTTGTGVLQGSPSPTATIDITNPAPNATDNDLDLEACTYAGNVEISVTSTDPLTAALAPQSAATETVSFSCNTTNVGNFSGTYTCPYSTDGVAGPEGTATYELACSVRAPESAGNPPNGSSSNASITAPPGGSTTNTVITFSETNNEGLDITDLSCSLATGTDFAIVAPAFPATIPSGGSIAVDVSFTDPGVAGPYTDVMTCTYTDSAGVSTIIVDLRGSVQAIVVPTMSWLGYVAMMLGLLLVGSFGFRRNA